LLTFAYIARFEAARFAYFPLLIEVTVDRSCRALNQSGLPCRQPPQLDSDFCFWHDPANEKEVAEARRMGGINRRREQTLATVYELEGLGTLEDILRAYELAFMQSLSLDNSVARNRAIADVATAAARLYRDNEMARQIEQIKSVIEGRLPTSQPRKKRWGLF